MKMPVSEIVDRFTIIKLKCERLSEEFEPERAAYEKELSNYPGIQVYIDRLYEVNKDIWDLESDIRRGRENELGLEEVGRRSIEIRKINAKRIAIKNEIVKTFGEGFEDKKLDHASEE